MNVSEISTLVGTPEKLKVALNGIWETSLELPLLDSPPTVQTIRNFIGPARDVAFEVFFTSPVLGTSFVGIRLSGLDGGAQARQIVTAFDKVAGGSWPTLNDIVENLGQRLESVLLDGVPDALEVGVEGLWRSVGSLVVWSKGESLPTDESLKARLDSHATLFVPHPNPLMLEFAFLHPIPHWLAVQVSVQIDDGHRLNMDALRNVAQSYLF